MRTVHTPGAALRAATVQDVPGAYRVCRRTGLAGSDASSLHADPDLLGHVWVGPYLHAPGTVARVVHDDRGVAGYCVAAADTAGFEDWLEEVWLPPLRSAHPRGSGATPADAALVRRIHTWPRTDHALLERFPAHLHVDLLPRAQGSGWGRRLVMAVLEALAARGAGGVHLVVDPTNTGALAFYERMAFSRSSSEADGITFVRSLTR